MRDASVGHQCPECVAEGRRTQRQPRTAFGASRIGQSGYVTITLIVINSVLLLASALSARNPGTAFAGGGWGGLLGGDTPLLDKLGAVGACQLTTGEIVPCGVSDGEWYRLFTSMFMHVGLIHLLLNMIVLWMVGRPLEALFGPVRFLGLYLISGLGGSVAVYLFDPVRGGAGASGAIFGLFAVLFLALRKLGLNAAAILPTIIINLIFTFAIPNISIAAHLGGLVTGAVVGAGVAYAPKVNRNAIQAGVLIGAVLLLGLLTIWQTARLTA
jgi:membrane associated rhomboid family serine protease